MGASSSTRQRRDYPDFLGNDGASACAIAAAEGALEWCFPPAYQEFIELANGGAGWIGENYLILWPVEVLAPYNADYQVQDLAPGLILFGSSGGGEGYAFDTRPASSAPAPSAIVRVPFIGMELKYAETIAADFPAFLANLKT